MKTCFVIDPKNGVKVVIVSYEEAQKYANELIKQKIEYETFMAVLMEEGDN